MVRPLLPDAAIWREPGNGVHGISKNPSFLFSLGAGRSIANSAAILSDSLLLHH